MLAFALCVCYLAAAVAAAAGKAPAAGAAAAAAVGAGGRGRGTSEIASCNYIARSQGVQKGMWLRPALDRCPSLVLLPYDFEGIERASEGLFQAALSLSHRLAPLSCDEVRQHTRTHSLRCMGNWRLFVS